jgi:hypothetical protein
VNSSRMVKGCVGEHRKDQANRDITFDKLAGDWRIFQVHIQY